MSVVAHPDRFVDEFLTDEESLIYRESPDMKAWLFGQVLDLGIFLFFVWVMAVTSNEVIRLGAFIGAAVVVGWFVYRFLDIWYTRYVLTSHRALRVSGVLRTDCEWMAWSKVTDVSVSRTVGDRMLHTATIEIRNANEASQFRAMSDVPRPMEFARLITHMVNARQRRAPDLS